tara:strand:+ start:2024 stop:2245 length:222 start_codon:yes stop_codon:yes gene_type:complete
MSAYRKIAKKLKKGEELSDKEKKQQKLRKHLMKSMRRKKEGGYTKDNTDAQYSAWDPKRTTKKKKKSLKIKDD